MCLYFPKEDLLNRITKVTDHKGKVVTYGYSGSADGYRSADLRRRSQRLQRWGSGFLLGQGVYSRALCRWYPPGHLGTTLSPKDTTTVEQAILLTLRAYQLF